MFGFNFTRLPGLLLRNELAAELDTHLKRTGEPRNRFYTRITQAALESDAIYIDKAEAALLVEVLKKNWDNIKVTDEADAVLNLMAKLNGGVK